MGYLDEARDEFIEVLHAGDKDAIVKFHLDKLLESYRNGQKSKPKVAKKSS